MIKSTHGGLRKGAGRKALPEAKRLKRIDLMLADSHIQKARTLGLGNLSLGVRRAIDKA